MASRYGTWKNGIPYLDKVVDLISVDPHVLHGLQVHGEMALRLTSIVDIRLLRQH
jgi:hypothetical protein